MWLHEGRAEEACAAGGPNLVWGVKDGFLEAKISKLKSPDLMIKNNKPFPQRQTIRSFKYLWAPKLQGAKG